VEAERGAWSVVVVALELEVVALEDAGREAFRILGVEALRFYGARDAPRARIGVVTGILKEDTSS